MSCAACSHGSALLSLLANSSLSIWLPPIANGVAAPAQRTKPIRLQLDRTPCTPVSSHAVMIHGLQHTWHNLVESRARAPVSEIKAATVGAVTGAARRPSMLKAEVVSIASLSAAILVIPLALSIVIVLAFAKLCASNVHTHARTRTRTHAHRRARAHRHRHAQMHAHRHAHRRAHRHARRGTNCASRCSYRRRRKRAREREEILRSSECQTEITIPTTELRGQRPPASTAHMPAVAAYCRFASN